MAVQGNLYVRQLDESGKSIKWGAKALSTCSSYLVACQIIQGYLSSQCIARLAPFVGL